jgi:hypothetical protein
LFERFNFYDVYAYLLPGAVLIGLVLVPGMIVEGALPEMNVGIVLASAVLAYVLGHLVHPVAKGLFGAGPEAQKFLADDSKLSGVWARQKVRKILSERFGLDVSAKDPARDAFHICRAVVAQAHAARSLEQWQGLYAAMRNCAAAFVLSASCGLGCTLSLLAWRLRIPRFWTGAVGFLVEVALLAWVTGLSPQMPELREKLRKTATRWCLVAGMALAAFGFLHAARDRISTFHLVALAGTVAILFASHRVLVRRSEEFWEAFARELFMSFIVVENPPPSAVGGGRSPEHPPRTPR